MKYTASVGEPVVLTKASDGSTLRILASSIQQVQTDGGTGSFLTYWESNLLKQVTVTQSPAAISSTAGILIQLTRSADSVVIYLNSGNFDKWSEMGSGSRVFLKNPPTAWVDVTQTPNAITALLQTASPVGDFVTITTSQTITGAKVWTATNDFQGLIVEGSADSVDPGPSLNQANAKVLTGQTNYLVNSFDGDSYKLLPLASYTENQKVTVKGYSQFSPVLYPAVGENLGYGTNIPIAIAPLSTLVLQKEAGVWKILQNTTFNGSVFTARYDITNAIGVGTVGVHTMEVAVPLPIGGYITRAWAYVSEAFVSGGAATIALGVDATAPSGLLAATAYNDPSLAGGFVDLLPDGTAATFTPPTNAVRRLILTIAGAAITQGAVTVYYEVAMNNA
jgi:hypothetical protein